VNTVNGHRETSLGLFDEKVGFRTSNFHSKNKEQCHQVEQICRPRSKWSAGAARAFLTPYLTLEAKSRTAVEAVAAPKSVSDEAKAEIEVAMNRHGHRWRIL
jgi:hypothetical protein